MNFENICTPTEASFLLSQLKHTDNVLEWGSGQLSLQIANKVKHVSVITHDLNQYASLQETRLENMEAILVPINQTQQSDDGTYDEYKDYISASHELKNRFGKFNVIIIRGRARVECAKFCEQIAHENCRIFIQDYNHPNSDYLRAEYFKAEEYLTRINGEFTMYMFIIKDKPTIDASRMPIFLNDTNVTDSFDPKLKANQQTATKKPRKVTELPKTEKKRVTKTGKKIFNQS